MYDSTVTDGTDAKFRAHREFGDRRELVSSARTYFYEDEAHCDENMEIFLKGIDCVSGEWATELVLILTVPATLSQLVS